MTLTQTALASILPEPSPAPVRVSHDPVSDIVIEAGIAIGDPIIIWQTPKGWKASFAELEATAPSHIVRSPHLRNSVYDLGVLDARKALCDAHPALWAATWLVNR